jgi:alpha-tubulin suppressor-like RCC1 family protein
MNKSYLGRNILGFLALFFLIAAMPLSAQSTWCRRDGHSIATDPSGKVYTWGWNTNGQLGNGTYTYSYDVPVTVTTSGVLSGKTITAVAGGEAHSIALTSDGTVYTWGHNFIGQLGNGNLTDSNVPVAVTGLSGKTITAVAGGGTHSIALASDGTVYTWGFNFYGQLGNGNNTNSNVAVAVTGLSGKTITAIAGGLNHSIALATDGTVYTWGDNFSGQLGNGTNNASNVPVAVTGLSGKTITAVAGGGVHSIALAPDGTVYTWGENYFGQLGNGTNTYSNVPVAVTGLSGKTITAIAGGGLHSIALASDGKVYTWGYNVFGQLGNGTNTDSNVPVAVTGLSGETITAIASGKDHSFALASDGTVYTWGDNYYGQLGNGTNTDSNVPVVVDQSIFTWPAVSAPTPTEASENVISIFSDTYNPISNVDLNPNWQQTTRVVEVPIQGNNTLVYSGLNYQGIDFDANHQDVSGMEYLHVDFWSVNSTSLNIFLISPGPVETPYALTVPTNGNWTSVDIPIGDFLPVNLADVNQIKFEGDGDIYLDNIYFYKEPNLGPTTAAPIPTEASENVISIYSDAYTPITGLDLNPNWGQSTIVTEEQIQGNNTLVYSGLNYQGIDFDANHQDVSGMDFIHLDYWTSNSTSLNIFLISPGSVETPLVLTVPTNGNWTSLNIPLTEFLPVNLADVNQIKFEGDGDIYLDNIYFYKEPNLGPTTAAPIPTEASENVISIYSDAYTPITGLDLNPNWGQSTIVTEEQIQGNNTLVFSGLNYQGIDFDANHQDVSGMDFIHLDYWTSNSTSLNIFLISPGPVETPYALTVPTNGNWTSLNIPLTEFSPVNLADVNQIKFEGDGDIYLDNIYFYKEPYLGPTTAAPIPTEASENVISIYSDAYTPITGLDLNPNWGQSTIVTQELIQGNNTLVFSGLNYQGIDFDANHQDVSGMEYLHVDFWSVNSTSLNIFLISPGPVETPYALTVPTNGNWTSVDIPIGDFLPVNLADVFQLKFEGDGDIYLDNIYFYKRVSTSIDENIKPKIYTLEQNYPNPFNPVTTIKYGLPEPTNVKVEVFDVIGQRVALLVNEEQAAGYYKVNFGGDNLTSGLYIYRISAGDKFTAIKKMLMVK